MAALRALLIEIDSAVAPDVLAPLRAAGFDTIFGSVESLASGPWDLVVAGESLAGAEAARLAAARSSNPVPLLLIGPAGAARAARGEAAPDIAWLAPPFAPSVLVACARALAAAPPAMSARSTKLDARRLLEGVANASEEARAGRAPGSALASIRLLEPDASGPMLPSDLKAEAVEQAMELLAMDALPEESAAHGAPDELLLFMPGTVERAAERLTALRDRILEHRFWIGGQLMKLSPVIGYAHLADARGRPPLDLAREASEQARSPFDLEPRRWRGQPAGAGKRPVTARDSAVRAWLRRHSVLMQYVETLVLGLVVPFIAYTLLDRAGLDISEGVYIFVVAALAMTALFIWIEGFLALRRRDPPDEPATPYPPASAIIAAYLPNEAPIIEDTIRAFLRVRYPAPLQVILAYNTPKPMPEVEGRLLQLAREHPGFIPMRVQGSSSKAQNVNAALPYASGTFTAVFDADHQPDPDSFRRAWRWLSHGADVVQGHCLIRNGDASWVARVIAVEFENIYAVSHPGRSRLHGFGIFGGSNGYWKSELLWRLRMHGFMLTEDIDSSIRAVMSGHRIISDPYIVSRELAPETLEALMNQRLRWAQGWFQISKKWVVPALRSRTLTLRQKLGMLHLLAWREVYPWIAMQILPLIAFWAVKAGGLDKLDWLVPLFVVTTLFTFSTGPGQILFTYYLADPEIRRRGRWFVFYFLATTLFYAGLKNAWARVAQLKEMRGETAWIVTTRSSGK